MLTIVFNISIYLEEQTNTIKSNEKTTLLHFFMHDVKVEGKSI